MISVITL